jgi:hypothetical protein
VLNTPAITVKVRPIISHSAHPGRNILAKIGRALAILVESATEAVRSKRRNHTPMWGLHEGSRRWIEVLSKHPEIAICAEFDVADCFLNTPIELVLKALDYWLQFSTLRTRQQPWFSISKDGKHADHRGRSCSVNFWEFSLRQVRFLVEWELAENSAFVVVAMNKFRVLNQVKGLPIGGHLSAALVELVALYREHTVEWPTVLNTSLTSRYRDNYFLALQVKPDEAFYAVVAKELTDLLAMPVKFERAGEDARCLELRLKFTPGVSVHSTVAFRTDSDRQGESKDVTAWPPRSDPRLPLVLPSLIHGLAAKLRQYRVNGTRGFTASVRRAAKFFSERGYPRRWWVRRWTLALLRQGVPPGCMPQLLHGAV